MSRIEIIIWQCVVMGAMNLFLTGCNVTLPKIELPKKPVTQTTTTTTTTTTSTIQPAVNVGVAYTSANDFNWADAEGDSSVYCGGVEVRCLVNDGMMSASATHKANAWITRLARDSGGLLLTANADGSVTLIGNDFVTKNNKYHFEGFKVKTDQSKLIAQQTIKLKIGRAHV